jgi:hypothetical protein
MICRQADRRLRQSLPTGYAPHKASHRSSVELGTGQKARLKYHLFFAMTTLLVLTAYGASRGGNNGNDGPKIGESEDDKWEELEKIRQLIVSATPDKLQELMGGANDGIAIRAAWEKVRRQLAQDIAGHRQKIPEGILFKGTNRFVGFLEGRLRIPVPRWWGRELTEARTSEFDRPRFFWNREVGEKVGPRDISNTFGTVPTIERNKDRGVKIAWDNRTLQFSAKEIPEQDFDSLTGVVYRNRCLLVQYTRDDFPKLRLEIDCVDVSSSKIAWSIQRTFDDRPGRASGHTGASIHEVALVCRDDVVYVFGMELSMVYIEALRFSDGHALMRFNDSY